MIAKDLIPSLVYKRGCATDWCRHIELKEDLRHTLDPSTHFRSDPTRIAHCNLHGYRSKLGNPDWRAVISAFKPTYCEGCPDKNPLEDSSHKPSDSAAEPKA